MYILDDFNFKLRPDLCVNIEGEFECIVAEIKARHNKRNLIVVEVYHIPNTSERESIQRYDDLITRLCETGYDILVGTDQNLDYMKVDSNTNVSDLLEVFFTLGVLPNSDDTN